MNRYYYEGYEVDEDVTDEEADSNNSSDNEIEKDFEPYKRKQTNKELADQFEREMDECLNEIVEKKENKKEIADTVVNKQETGLTVNVNKQENKNEKVKKEEEEESDTDSEAEEATGMRVKKKRVHYTNDELLYDPDMDDADEKWMNKQRITYKQLNKEGKKEEHKIKQPENIVKAPHSDAVLNCPCCMSLLTMDCQRHESYKCQYRAIFVFNCKTDENEILKYPKDEDEDKKKKRRKNKNSSSNTNKTENDATVSSYDEYKTVNCDVCNTQVGVYEPKEDLYHFFNVLASH